MPTSQTIAHGETVDAEGAVTCGVTVTGAAGRTGGAYCKQYLEEILNGSKQNPCFKKMQNPWS